MSQRLLRKRYVFDFRPVLDVMIAMCTKPKTRGTQEEDSTGSPWRIYLPEGKVAIPRWAEHGWAKSWFLE